MKLDPEAVARQKALWLERNKARAAPALAEASGPGARPAIGTFEDCLSRWRGESEV